LLVGYPEHHLRGDPDDLTSVCKQQKAENIFGKVMLGLFVVVDSRCEGWIGQQIHEVSL